MKLIKRAFGEWSFNMKFIKRAFGEFDKVYEMTTSVIFCLLFALSNGRFIPFKTDIISTKMHCCHGRRHEVTCSRRKCYKTCGHNIIYDMTLSTE